MSTPKRITDYMAYGTHAARPASPSVNAGETALYYETDTTDSFIWSGAAWVKANGSAPTSVVQNKSITGASHATGITLTSAPIQGNLLIALVSDQPGAPSAGAGWTMIASAGAAQDGYGVLWKLAGAGESATQTPCSDTHQGTITVYEISNGSPGAVTAVTGYTGTAVAEIAVNTKLTGGGGLIIGIFVNRSTTGPTSLTGTGVALDNTASGVSRFVQAFRITSPVNGNNTVTANYATSQGGVFVAIAVG